MQKIKQFRHLIFFGFTFIIYTLSFSFNILRVTDDNFRFFDRVDESMIIGRLIASQHEGPLAYSGLVGGYQFEYYIGDDGSLIEREHDYNIDGSLNQQAHISSIYNDYTTGRKIYNGEYVAYKSQPGGQGLIYSLLQEIIPLDNSMKLQIIRLISIMLNALFLSLFMVWIYHNFNLAVAITTFILSAFIPILILFGYSLWWVLWSYYIPFCLLLLILDKRKRQGRKLFDNKLLIYTTIFTFFKFFLTGFEFITSSLVMSVCPIIYYLILDKEEIKEGLIFFFKSCIAAFSGIALGIIYLIGQIYFLTKNWEAGIDHIMDAFFRRSAYSSDAQESAVSVIKTYLERDVFRFDWNLDLTIKYSTLLIIILTIAVLFFFVRKKVQLLQERKYFALCITTLISLLAPLSWFVIFSQHASVHSLDIIVWYLPFCLFAFAMIGTTFDTGIQYTKKILGGEEREVRTARAANKL